MDPNGTTIQDEKNVNHTEPSSSEAESKPSTSLTREQKLVFCGIAASYVFNLMSFAIMAPFFPVEAKKKGLTTTQVGFIFALFNLMNFLTSPIFGKYLPVVGAKFMFLSGAFVAAGCNILFGILDEIEDTQTFLIYCFVIRAVEACGSAASITASMTITANTFPNNMAQMMGLLESFSGLGFMAGPPLGGLFYSIGGYKLPFLVLGGMSLATILVNVFLLPSVGVEQTKSGSVKNMFLIPSFYPVAIGVIVGSSCLGFLDPTLSLHLSSYNLSPSLVAVAFLLIGGVYAITSPIWGYIADKKKNTKIMMVLGFYISCISYLLLGPSPVLKLPNELWIVILSLGMTGFSLGCAMMPAFLDLFMAANWYGFPDDLSTQGVVSGIFNSLFSLGGFLGPLLGGYLVQLYGFPWAASIFAAANLAVMLLICLFSLWEYRCGMGRRLPWIKFDEVTNSSEEREPLLTNNASESSSPEKSVNV